MHGSIPVGIIKFNKVAVWSHVSSETIPPLSCSPVPVGHMCDSTAVGLEVSVGGAVWEVWESFVESVCQVFLSSHYPRIPTGGSGSSRSQV